MNGITAVVEIILGSLVLLGVAVLLVNSQLCFFNQASCGMTEPVIAVYALPVGVSLLAAGIFRRKDRSMASNLAYIPALIVALLLLGQFRLWW